MKIERKTRRYTEEERKKLMDDYNSSEKSKKDWCRDNNIPIATFHGWLQKEILTSNEPRISFIELKKEKEKKNASVDIEIDNIKIQCKEINDIKKLLKVIEAVYEIC